MIPGAEGLALIPFIPLLLLGIALLGLGVLLLLGAGFAVLAGWAVAGSLGKAGTWSGAVGLALVLVFAGIGMQVRWRSRPGPEVKKDVKLYAAFDLRTAHSFSALGLDDWIQTDTSLDDTVTRKIALVGELTVDVQVTDRLRYRGTLTSLTVDDDREDPSLIRSVWMETAPLPWDECAKLAASAKELSSDEQGMLEQWRTKRLGRELWFDSSAERSPHLTVFLPLSNARSTTCVLTLEVFWKR